jgi:group I intron endonuclease
MFIYLIVNHITGKYYVGQHKGGNLKKYLTSKIWDALHSRNLRSYLYASIRKHGAENFSIHALLSDIQTKTELDQKEKDFISFLKSQDPDYGYNICRGGEGFTGPHSEGAKKKNSEASKLMWSRPGYKEKFSEKMKGHLTSIETIDKIKAARNIQDEPKRLEAFNKWKLTVDSDHFKKIGAAASKEDKSRAGKMGSKEDKSRAGLLGATLGGPKARHVRWHVNRKQINPDCSLCLGENHVSQW